jgi:hypothetical protein
MRTSELGGGSSSARRRKPRSSLVTAAGKRLSIVAAVATGMCPECMKFMLFEQLMLTNTKDSFPKLGREVTEATPTTCYL